KPPAPPCMSGSQLDDQPFLRHDPSWFGYSNHLYVKEMSGSVALAHRLHLRYTSHIEKLGLLSWDMTLSWSVRISTMHRMRLRIAYFVLSLSLLLVSGCTTPSSSQPSVQPTRSTATQAPSVTPSPTQTITSSIPYLHLPPGFQISVYARGLH